MYKFYLTYLRDLLLNYYIAIVIHPFILFLSYFIAINFKPIKKIHLAI